MSTTTKQVISNEAFEPELGGASLRTQGVSTDPRPRPSLRSQTTALGKHLLTRGAWLGVYDFKGLFVPRWRPYAGQKARRRGEMGTVREPPFYGLEDELPILLAAVAGFQHMLAMLAGLITPPIIISSSLNLPSETQSYLISASLIACGILSAVQMSAIPLLRGYQLGTGLLSVVGTSFATLSTATAIFDNLYKDGTCPTITLADGTTSRGACPEAYGYLIGTAAVCGLLEMALSFVPVRLLRKAFPPVVTGGVVTLIGASLIGSSGFLDWAGGSGDCSSRPTSGQYVVCPQVGGPHALPWGSAEYLGLGFLSFMTIVVVEIFGSPVMRNGSVVIGLLFPLVVAGPLGYIGRSNIDSAQAITFLWTTTFKLKVYGPAVLPLLAVYVSLMMEAIGDITASSEVSRLEVDGPEFDKRIQGGVLADGFNGIIAALMTVTPLSVFAQNNGVIALTRCANRRAGYFACFWLILFGMLGKIAGVVLSIPKSVLGGVTTFLFASVTVSGIRVLAFVKWTRRTRYVLACALSVGLGNLLVPTWSEYLFTYEGGNKALSSFLDSITIVISTPFLIAAIFGIVANLILPYDEEDDDEHEEQDERARARARAADERMTTDSSFSTPSHLEPQSHSHAAMAVLPERDVERLANNHTHAWADDKRAGRDEIEEKV